MQSFTGSIVESPLGRRAVDTEGAPLGVARLDAKQSYAGIHELLQRYIDAEEKDEAVWGEIQTRVDYTYEALDHAMGALQGETGFGAEILRRVRQGERLLFKPNLVNIVYVDPSTHGPGMGSSACTEWTAIAALMRWFHDRLGVSYHQMALGEAATTLAPIAAQFSLLHPQGEKVTTEAVIEGRAGGFYGGWAFYFVRKYLAARHDPEHADDPFQGYAESVAGTYVPPGLAADKLMVYDLNRIFDDPRKGREVAVPNGANFGSVTLHKAVVGGAPGDAADRRAYPGCILVNVPKLKAHTHAIFTNVIKNLGIGLYPMQVCDGEEYAWKYAYPACPTPGMKALIPHQVWVPEIDPETMLPVRGAGGEYVVRRTAGMPGTMVDIIDAVKSQGVFMIHVVDAIQAVNWTNVGGVAEGRQDEGLIVAGLDPVAADLFCARYMFSNVPLAEAMGVDLVDRAGGHFPQRVPMPRVESGTIVTGTGYDCPLARDRSFEYAAARGIGETKYHVAGWDAGGQVPLASLEGRLGAIENGAFRDLHTQTLYFAMAKPAWDLQAAFLAYLEANDRLAGSKLKQSFLRAFDEDGDGEVTYEECGKKGAPTVGLYQGGAMFSRAGSEPLGTSCRNALNGLVSLRCSKAAWNEQGHDFYDEYSYGGVFLTAWTMSQLPNEAVDPFCPALTWGKGKWPSFELASHMRAGILIYGTGFPYTPGILGLYVQILQYVDRVQNDSRYAGPVPGLPNMEGIGRYLTEVSTGAAKPLDFTLYVPTGYGTLGGRTVPNVVETTDPAKILTATIGNGA